MDSENGATDGRVNPDPITLQQRCGGERHQAQSRMGFTPRGRPGAARGIGARWQACAPAAATTPSTSSSMKAMIGSASKKACAAAGGVRARFRGGVG
jgi:hypothetical protein